MGVVSGLVHVVISLAVIVLINKISLERLLFITVFGIVDLIFSIFAVMSFGWCFVYTVVDIVIIFHAIKAYRGFKTQNGYGVDKYFIVYIIHEKMTI